ncbi:aspartate aminotransferase family protein [Psychroserpens sp.]|uniref:aspartate aminotransferase family protein n=1 Tax=Psychroserpens sp. TaxID=2020870 RepID=UPI001B1F823F|nr:aspartate aminotransferase family protein [Psychroserpens sp.]MBO6606306.1 aspartate aminotransferase family protein [Psychroserpens sp.]MBO6631059.1 aspartate aminotransferase family protein [Psychroserpens sp.]MBO6653010.1 aspartate aminotransferase family protein [Psychroserpens sp.]MBO6680963.1 aspartate aminotransferase family protein [Psychroserpens sp.]MBO6750081.1 aspartate aminotransferase family protein [Psychroserpens sp.]
MKSDFFKYQAQTTPHPLAMSISHANGSYIYDTDGKSYLDFVAGVSACSLGHQHPKVVKAIKDQLDKYLHVMVYGEYIQESAVELTKLLASVLPEPLEKTYLTNSGTEAIDGAIKLARRVTGRSEIIAAKHAYHGNTIGALSIMGFEERKRPFRPLMPDVRFVQFNALGDLSKITEKTAAVVLESIQGGAGFIEPTDNYLSKVKARCEQVGALLILDEIQPGFGRTGKLFGFEHFNCVPDILVTGKGLGGGMPIGAFTSSAQYMDTLYDNPKLGHITTFGGHPVIAASALATLKEITESNLIEQALEKENIIRERLRHPLIEEIRGRGLMLAAMTPSAEITNEVILQCQDAGLILFWLLFEPRAIRITPPLTVSNDEIIAGCDIILRILDSIKA